MRFVKRRTKRNADYRGNPSADESDMPEFAQGEYSPVSTNRTDEHEENLKEDADNNLDRNVKDPGERGDGSKKKEGDEWSDDDGRDGDDDSDDSSDNGSGDDSDDGSSSTENEKTDSNAPPIGDALPGVASLVEEDGVPMMMASEPSDDMPSSPHGQAVSLTPVN